MKYLLLICFAVGLSQAYDYDWDSVQHIGDVQPFLKNRFRPPLKAPFGFPEGRIVGGNEATPHQFPHQAALLVQLGKQTAFCGGSLISKRYVLTAAHCAFMVKNFTVILGAHKIKENEPSQQVYYTKEKVVHPKWIWSQLLLVNDIALVKLPIDAVLNENVQPIRLPSRSEADETFVRKQATVSGWGKDTDASNTVSPVLRYVTNPVIPNAECNIMMFGAIKPSHICLSGRKSRGACNGDSGGPMIITDTDNAITQIGIVSFGLSLGCENIWPTVFTRITSHLDFIENHSDIEIRQ